MKRASIKWKIFLYLLGFCILLLVILWLFQTVFLDSFYKRIKLSEVQKQAAAIARHVADEDWNSLYDIVDQRGDLYVEIWSEDSGPLLISGDVREDGPPKPLPGAGMSMSSLPGMEGRSQFSDADKLTLLREAAQNGGSLVKRSAGGNNWSGRKKESILYAVSLQAKEGTDTLLLVSANISPVDATVETLRIQLWYISGIMLVLSVGLALLISRRVSGPIVKLNNSARELGRGDYDIAFHTEGYREIEELSDTLDNAARELAKTDRLRKELIANVSHDLRTPLTLISGYGEMIRDLPGENTPENMQVIVDESNRLLSLVNNLLDLSRLQSGTVEMRISRFDLTLETEKIIERFSKLCEQEGFVIRFEREGGVFINGDPERIAQIIYNFLINAVNHTGPDKLVTVRQTVRDGRVTTAVADTGNGIAPEDRPLIWERYYKVDKVHRRGMVGTGLGLSIVKSILEQHPGVKYGVESEPEQGSSFWFSIPVAE